MQGGRRYFESKDCLRNVEWYSVPSYCYESIWILF